MPAPSGTSLPTAAPVQPAFTRLLWCAMAVALFLIAHNFCLSLLPSIAVPLDPGAIVSVPGARGYAIAFDDSPGDTELNPRSRVSLTEDGRPLKIKFRLPQLALSEGQGSWSHAPGRIFFSASDDSDPRRNGRSYVAYAPPLYSHRVGYGALLVLFIAGWGLRRASSRPKGTALARAPLPTPGPLRSRWSAALRWHVLAAGLVFLAALYVATGTLAPYAATMLPHPDPATGYLYNIDHELHRTLFAFVDGQPRQAWGDSILLRRIVYPVLAWPWMKTFGYESGGVVFNLVINFAGFIAGVLMVRRHVGERGAMLAAWLLALYPGAAYWVGQPYLYALIFPLGIAAFWVLLELPQAKRGALVALSLGLGVIYLSYDFHAYFLPASVLLLAWHRRFGGALASAVIQVIPLGAWLWALKNVVQMPLENSNTTIYRGLIDAFFNPANLGASLQRVVGLPEVATDVFFGANFFFLPLLALAAWSLDFRWRDFTRHRAVPVLLAAGLALFLFCNVPPPHPGPWNLSGSWIARLYQPLFPALVLSLAWWWQELRPTTSLARSSRLALVILLIVGNAAVCFGPILGAPEPTAAAAYYRFYDHTDLHWAYGNNLRRFGRRPIGFPQPLPAPP